MSYDNIIIYRKDITPREKENRRKLVNEFYKCHPSKYFLTDSIWKSINHVICIDGSKKVWIKTYMGYKNFKRLKDEKYQLTTMKGCKTIYEYRDDKWWHGDKYVNTSYELNKYRLIMYYIHCMEQIKNVFRLDLINDLKKEVIKVYLRQYRLSEFNNIYVK